MLTTPGRVALFVDGFSARDAIHNKNIAGIYIKYFISLNRARRERVQIGARVSNFFYNVFGHFLVVQMPLTTKVLSRDSMYFAIENCCWPAILIARPFRVDQHSISRLFIYPPFLLSVRINKKPAALGSFISLQQVLHFHFERLSQPLEQVR